MADPAGLWPAAADAQPRAKAAARVPAVPAPPGPFAADPAGPQPVPRGGFERPAVAWRMIHPESLLTEHLQQREATVRQSSN